MGVKNIQTEGYNGASTVYKNGLWSDFAPAKSIF